VFDDLFTNIFRGTDVVVRAPERLKSDFGAGERPNVPADLLDTVRQAPGVADAQGSVIVSYAQIIGPDGEPVGDPGAGPPVLGFGWVDSEDLNQWNLLQGGRAPTTDSEVVIDKRSADKGDIKVGDEVTILTTEAPKKYEVVGIARFGSADSPAGASASVFEFSEAQRLANAKNEYQSIGVVAAGGVSQTQLADDVQQHLSQQGQSQYEVITGKDITEENQDAIRKQLGFFTVALTIFALIALVVGAFIIYNTFSIVVAQRTKELALLRALGASQGQVLGEVIGESFVVGLVASAVGVVSGIGLAIGLRALFAAVGFDLPGSGVTIPPSALVIGMVVGLVITMLSAIVPARQAARVPPVAAMRDVAIEREPRKVLRFLIGGGSMLIGIAVLFVGLFTDVSSAIQYVGIGAVLVFIGAFVLGPLFARTTSRIIGAPLTRLKGMTGTLARENASRNPKRTATTATALVIGVALVGFITVFAASAKASISKAVDDSFKTDFIIQSGAFAPGSGLSTELAKQIRALPEIDASSGVRVGHAQIDGRNVYPNAIDPEQAQRLLDLGGTQGSFADLGPNTIAVSQAIADEKGYRIGDELPTLFVDTGTKPLKIAYIFKENNFGSQTIDYWLPMSVYEDNFNDQLDLVVLASLKPGVTAEQGRAAIEPLVEPFPTAELQDNAQYKADQEQQINQIVGLIYLLLFLALFTALIGIANTLALSIHERTREIGLLRAVGMARSQVRSAIRWESVIISLLGTINGLAIGLFFGWSVVKALEDQGFSQFAIAPGQLTIVVIILAVLSVAAAWLPARRASKLDVLRAISTE
jgi:putative ABC transport system permease protein